MGGANGHWGGTGRGPRHLGGTPRHPGGAPKHFGGVTGPEAGQPAAGRDGTAEAGGFRAGPSPGHPPGTSLQPPSGHQVPDAWVRAPPSGSWVPPPPKKIDTPIYFLGGIEPPSFSTAPGTTTKESIYGEVCTPVCPPSMGPLCPPPRPFCPPPGDPCIPPDPSSHPVSHPPPRRAVGCIFGELLNLSPLFPGENDIEQLCCVLRALGTPSPRAWPVSYWEGLGGLGGGKRVLRMLEEALGYTGRALGYTGRPQGYVEESLVH